MRPWPREGGAGLEETQGTKRGEERDGVHLCGPLGLRVSQGSGVHRREVWKGADFRKQLSASRGSPLAGINVLLTGSLRGLAG